VTSGKGVWGKMDIGREVAHLEGELQVVGMEARWISGGGLLTLIAEKRATDSWNGTD
jgi:hypothetical protein